MNTNHTSELHLTRDGCLRRAQVAIRDIMESETPPSRLEFSAIREWVRRAEFAHLNGGSIREHQFEQVTEHLDSTL